MLEKYIKFIEEHFTPRVSEDKNGMCVTLKNNSEIVPDCKVWFEKAKRGWNKKPISYRNTYIITNAEVGPLLDFMDIYMGLGEDDYNEIRVVLVHYTMDIIDKHLNGEK